MPEPRDGGSFGVHLYRPDFRFDAGHFLVFPDGTREALHGHNYQVRVRIDGPLGPGDVVVDFLWMKPIIRAVCGELDHILLLPERNEFLRIRADGEFFELSGAGRPMRLHRDDVRLLPLSNTSVELLAEHVAGRLLEEMRARDPGVVISSLEVEVEETPGQAARYRSQP
jgi:6-pyruvoyltetrahydropterin/6-carboxytetrahydropterin synthase